MPQGRDILGQGEQHGAPLQVEPRGLLGSEALEREIQSLEGQECFVPVLLEVGGHQPVLGVDRLVGATGLLHVVATLFEPLCQDDSRASGLVSYCSRAATLSSRAAGSRAARFSRSTACSKTSPATDWQRAEPVRRFCAMKL
jgi:hypothetical protein